MSYNYKADNWSLGVLVFQLLTGELPPDPPRFERKPTFHAGDFVNRLLRTKPEERMNLKDALDHAWIVNLH